MDYKINPDAKYMMYDKPIESDYLRKSIKNAVDMIVNSEWTNSIGSIVIPKETYEILNREINKK